MRFEKCKKKKPPNFPSKIETVFQGIFLEKWIYSHRNFQEFEAQMMSLK